MSYNKDLNKLIFIIVSVVLISCLIKMNLYPLEDDKFDFSSPEALYRSFISATNNEDVEGLRMCYDARALKILGDTKEEQQESLKQYQEKRVERFKNAEIQKIDMTGSDIADYDARIMIIRNENNKVISSFFFCKKINGQWKITVPKIPKKDQSKDKYKTKEIDQPEKVEEMK